MNFKCLLLLGGIILHCLATDIHNQDINVEIKGRDVTVTVSDDPYVISMLFSTEIGEECAPDYFYFNNSNAFSIRLEGNNNPTENATLRMFRIIETKDQVLAASNNFKIDANGKNHIIDMDQMGTCDKPKYDDKLNCLLAESDSDDKQCSGQLILQESFLGNNLSTNWNFVQYSRVYTQHKEFVAFVKHKENCYLEKNKLYLKATVPKKCNISEEFYYNECTYEKADNKQFLCGPYRLSFNKILPPVHSAAITTRSSSLFKYVKIEIRAKMPVGDWLFPYLLLYPSYAEFESLHKLVPHIRIAYSRGNLQIFDSSSNALGGNILFGSVFSKVTDPHETLKSCKLETGEAHYGEHFHSYTLIRHRDRIIYKVDDKIYGEIDNPFVLAEINKNKHYIVLGLTAGGSLNFPTENSFNSENLSFLNSPRGPILFEDKLLNITKTWKHPMLVIDYVRVYTTHSEES